MSLREELNACAPRLRRYARALTGGNPARSARADDLVHAALVRALGARNQGSASDLPARLYATVTQLHRETYDAGQRPLDVDGSRPALVAGPLATALARQSRLSDALMALPLDEREALLLVALEGFNHAEAARILRVSRATLLSRLTRARSALDLSLTAAPARPAPRTRAPHLRLVT